NYAPLENWSRVHDLLPLVDIFLPNEEEAKRISGESDVVEAGKWLAQNCAAVIIKQGPKGSTYFSAKEVQQFKIPAKLKQNLVISDTTGAGDNFDAGFLFEWLQGQPLDVCMETAI